MNKLSRNYVCIHNNYLYNNNNNNTYLFRKINHKTRKLTLIRRTNWDKKKVCGGILIKRQEHINL